MDYYFKYLIELRANGDNFISEERRLFPEEYSEGRKVKSEYVALHSYYNDRMQNEVYFDESQSTTILETLGLIREMIEHQDYEECKYYIVSLQLLLNLDVKFRRTLTTMIHDRFIIENIIDTEAFIPNKEDGNDYGRKK